MLLSSHFFCFKHFLFGSFLILCDDSREGEGDVFENTNLIISEDSFIFREDDESFEILILLEWKGVEGMIWMSSSDDDATEISREIWIYLRASSFIYRFFIVDSCVELIDEKSWKCWVLFDIDSIIDIRDFYELIENSPEIHLTNFVFREI
jgi:hypothetical protein